MRIALVDPSLYTWPYDVALADALRRAGHEAIVFGKALPKTDQRHGDPRLAPVFYRSMADVAKGQQARALFLARKGASHLASMVRLVRTLRRWRPDVIHIHWLLFPLVDRAFLATLRRIAPLVLTVHDTNPFNDNPALGLQAVGAIAILRRFDRLIVHTDQGVERLAHHGVQRNRVARIAHGLLHEPAAPPPPPPFLAGDGKLTLLQFGLIKPYKGIDLLIRAAAGLPPGIRTNVVIRVVGRPEMDIAPLTALARELAVEDVVHFDFRFVPDSDLDRMMAGADVLLFPYREIEASGVLLSALAWRRPVIATRIGLFAELISDGQDGLLVPREDPDALRAAITRLVSEPGLLARLAAGSDRLARQVPSWDAIARETTAVYESAIAPRV